MLELKNKPKRNRSDILIFLLFTFAFGLSLYCIYFDESVFGLIQETKIKNVQPIVGAMDILVRDIRKKEATSVLWEKARHGDQIRIGDRVFTGKGSSLRVILEQGGNLDLGENTMITFSSLKGKSVANLSFGKMKVNVDGSAKIAINGKIQTIKGKQSQIEISVDAKQKPKFRIIHGDVQVTAEPIEIAKTQLVDEKSIILPPKAEEIVVKPKLIPISSQQEYFYTEQLEYIYESRDQKLFLREEKPNQVAVSIPLHWGIKGIVHQMSGQLSNNQNFEAPMQSFEAEADSYELKRAYLGENYWRLMGAGLEWTLPLEFKVTSRPLSVSPPKLKLTSSKVYLLSNSVPIRAQIETNEELKSFIVEISSSAAFNNFETQVRLKQEPSFNFNASKAQDFFIRLRGVNAKNEVTAYSPIQKLEILEAPMPTPPKLASKSYKLYVDQVLDIEWDSSKNAKEYEISVVNKTGQIVESRSTSGNKNQFNIATPGEYQIAINAIDRFGRKSASSFAKLILEERKLVVQAPRPQLVERQISSTSSLSTVQKIAEPTNLNQNYSKSTLELDGGGQAAMSSQEFSNTGASELPQGASMSLKLVHWIKESGIAVIFGTKLASLNAASAKISPMQIETRYNHRWNIPWNILSNIKATQFSLIGGYEYYRNGTSGPYSPGYDTVKAGFGLLFPISKNWDSGGEALYGRGLDASNQFEISGNTTYYLRSDWSIGIGYRIRLFEAGSSATAPSGGVPYREGFGEAYSILKLHY